MCDYCGRRGYHPACVKNRDRDIERYWEEQDQRSFLRDRGLLVEKPRQMPAWEAAGYRYMEKVISTDPADPHYGVKVKDIMTQGDVWHKIATKQLRVVNANPPYLVPSFKKQQKETK